MSSSRRGNDTGERLTSCATGDALERVRIRLRAEMRAERPSPPDAKHRPLHRRRGKTRITPPPKATPALRAYTDDATAARDLPGAQAALPPTNKDGREPSR